MVDRILLCWWLQRRRKNQQTSVHTCITSCRTTELEQVMCFPCICMYFYGACTVVYKQPWCTSVFYNNFAFIVMYKTCCIQNCKVFGLLDNFCQEFVKNNTCTLLVQRADLTKCLLEIFLVTNAILYVNRQSELTCFIVPKL